MATGTFKYNSTLNLRSKDRRYNDYVNNGIINNVYNEQLKYYFLNNDINEIYIDSTDIQNKNLPKQYTYKSFKLNKQALRFTILCDDKKIPLDYSITKAKDVDNNLGYYLLMKSKLKCKYKTLIFGDKGYQMKKYKLDNILEHNNLRLIVPKKKYKKKKVYKTKNYKPKIKRLRYSKQMKMGLKNRIKIEHLNSIIHRSYKRLDKIYDKKIGTFECRSVAFIKLAISNIIINII